MGPTARVLNDIAATIARASLGLQHTIEQRAEQKHAAKRAELAAIRTALAHVTDKLGPLIDEDW